MSLYSKLRTAMHNPQKAILYVTLGRSNYERVELKLGDIHRYSQIKPQNQLEAHMLEPSDISDHLMTLYMLTKQLNLQSILELGTRTGKSTVALLLAAKEIGGTVTSIDIVDCPEAKAKVASLGLTKYWRFIEVDDLLLEWNMPVDHLFIDTAHTYDQTLKELQKFEPYVNMGGVISLHDIVAFPDVLQAISKYLSERNDLQLYKYFNDNGLAVIFKEG
ncbi:MAG TPA: class I SAM-dependent methyltransferase [Dehalococcoidia bacterium]|nr:class I SAM-dependent methyltransferase [Dehalococcoidia bacterium]